MTDKELLEAAARAAGIDYDTEASKQKDGIKVWWGLWLQYDREPNEFDRRYWNPLTDDGDALRLAVKLGIDIQHFKESERVEAWISPWDAREEDYKSDRYAATRRAIVRATAALDSGHNA